MVVTIKTENVEKYIKEHFTSANSIESSRRCLVNEHLSDEILVSKTSCLSSGNSLIIELVNDYSDRFMVKQTYLYLMSEYDSISLKGILMKFSAEPIYK